MKQGLTLTEMAATIERQAARKEDFVIDTRQVTMLGGCELSLPVGPDDAAVEYALSDIAHRQIGARLGIHATYYDKLREPDSSLSDEDRAALRALLDTNVNTLFRRVPERRMVRTFTPDGMDGIGTARAFLSDRYRARDNDELAQHVLPILGRIPDVTFPGLEITDRNMYVKAVAPRLERDIAVGDPVQAGVMIKNSEVGHGSLSVQPFVYRLICLNGMVSMSAVRHYHVGKRAETDDTLRVLSDATMRLDDEAFFSAVADVVTAAVSETTFNLIVDQLRAARTGERIAKPVEAVERIAKRFALTEGEGESVLRHLIEGGDLSAYGALNAVTRAAHDADSYDRSTELEEIGGRMLDIAGTPDWHAIAA